MTAVAPAAASPAPLALLQGLAAPAGRLLLGAVFFVSGVAKIGAYAATEGYMAAMGVPGALLPAVIALELIAPIALVLGVGARVAAFLLAGFSVLAALLFHGDVADPMQQILFVKNLGLAGGLFLVVAGGPGPFSLRQ